MARLVKHEAQGPHEVKTAHGDSVFVCVCGLSKNQPLCDGSHHRTKDEQDKIYVYDNEKRVEVK
ncbi:MAG TPA: CDGSH iron-sulfur domain-containing protein [Candidatus Aenigmarchaeota archaeon]|nr:CDGSH iron-sulfur domain-containing protein [Candidatus Aenigmarchaeota archaeon]